MAAPVAVAGAADDTLTYSDDVEAPVELPYAQPVEADGEGASGLDVANLPLSAASIVKDTYDMDE